MNSTYLELVDIWFGHRGLGTLTAIGLLALALPVALALPLLWLQGFGVVPSTGDRHSLLLITLILTPIYPAAWGLVWLLRKDAFSYTHYPMRFDRKARLVHVFRTNGTVLTVPWDDLFITLGYERSGGATYGEVRAHVLAEDEVTVVESFGLSHRTLKSPTDPVLEHGEAIHPWSSYAQWEFLRRYMDEGPHAVIGEVKQCLSVNRERESTAFSFRFLADRYSGGIAILRVLTSPFWTVGALFRLVAMRTSQVPRWPAEVEAGGVIEDGDPYAIEGTPHGELVVLSPDAVRVAPSDEGALAGVAGPPPALDGSRSPEGAPVAPGAGSPTTKTAKRTGGRSSNRKGKPHRQK